MGSLWYRRARVARSMQGLANAAILVALLALAGCPKEAPPRDSGVGGVSTEYMGAGGAPPLSGGMTGGDTMPPAGAGGEGSAGAGVGGVVGGMTGGEPPAGVGGEPPAGQGGMGPII